LAARELILSFVPDAEQRTWRTITRSKQQLVGHKRRRNAVLILDKGDQPYLPVVNRVRLQNQTEALLEEMRIKLLTTGEDLRPAWSVTLLRGVYFQRGNFDNQASAIFGISS
jgi:hypothetical protein